MNLSNLGEVTILAVPVRTGSRASSWKEGTAGLFGLHHPDLHGGHKRKSTAPTSPCRNCRPHGWQPEDRRHRHRHLRPMVAFSIPRREAAGR